MLIAYVAIIAMLVTNTAFAAITPVTITGSPTTTAVGVVADGATSTGNPVTIGATALAPTSNSTSTPTPLAATQEASLRTDLQRRLLVEEAAPTSWYGYADNASTSTQIMALSGAGQSYYIVGAVFSASAAMTVKVISSTTAGNACATSPTVLIPSLYIPASGGAPLHFKQPIKVPANSAICCTIPSASGSCLLTGYVAP